MNHVAKLGVFLCAFAFAQSAFAQDRALIQAGAEVYMERCSSCHGENLVNPGWSFDLLDLRASERTRFDESVNNGKGGEMPAWSGLLGPKELDQIWAYIRSKAKN